MKAGILIAAVFMAMGAGGADVSASKNGAEIYNAILNKYKNIETYGDIGVMASPVGYGQVDTIRFSTKYKKPDEFRIEFGISVPVLFCENYVEEMVLYGNGQKAYLSRNNVVDEYPSIKDGLNASTGDSMGITSTIPSLFLGRGIGGGIHCFPESPQRLDDEEVLGKKCYHLRVKDYGGGMVDIWASKDDFLVRKVKTATKELLYESIKVDADAEWDVSAANATPKVRFVEVEGKSYSFSIPDNVKFKIQDEPERYVFCWTFNIPTSFMIFPNSKVRDPSAIPKIAKKAKASLVKGMKAKGDEIISATDNGCSYGLFVGSEIKLTVQVDPVASSDQFKQFDQYVFYLWDGNRGWGAILVSSNTNDIAQTRKILESGKPIK